MKTLVPTLSFHFMMEFRGMSEKSRYAPSLIQTGPSDHSNPEAKTSCCVFSNQFIKAGSWRTIFPISGELGASSVRDNGLLIVIPLAR